MADDQSVQQRRHDKTILISIVNDIAAQLKIIVFEKRDLFRVKYRRHFPSPWRDVEERLRRAATALAQEEFDLEVP